MITMSHRLIETIHRHLSVSECCVAVSSKMKTFQLGKKNWLRYKKNVKRVVKQHVLGGRERFYPIRKHIKTEINNSKVSGSP